MIVEYIDTHRREFGVEPICRELQVAPSTYYAAKTRPPSRRTAEDATLTAVIRAKHAANYGVYGARKMWKVLHRTGHPIGRCRVERLMRTAGLAGAVRGRTRRTIHHGQGRHPRWRPGQPRLHRHRPRQLWVADFTYVATWAGFATSRSSSTCTRG